MGKRSGSGRMQEKEGVGVEKVSKKVIKEVEIEEMEVGVVREVVKKV